MPIRMLRDWTQSEKVNQLNANAERFFTRLIMVVDDYGRFRANPTLLKSKLFPLKNDVRDADISRCLDECQAVGLILIYEVDGKSYCQIKDFGQRLRRMKPQYPTPDGSADEQSEYPGYVYLIGSDFNEAVKIGYSLNPWARVASLSTGNHVDIKVLCAIRAPKSFETDLHNALAQYCVRSEWFKLPEKILNEIIEVADYQKLRSKMVVDGSMPEEKRKEVKEKEKERTHAQTFGSPPGNFISVKTKYLGDRPAIIYGVKGLIDYMAENQTILNQPEYAEKFLRKYNGQVYNELSHVQNAYRKFIEDQHK